jgi:cytoskeletal protein RodZ
MRKALLLILILLLVACGPSTPATTSGQETADELSEPSDSNTDASESVEQEAESPTADEETDSQSSEQAAASEDADTDVDSDEETRELASDGPVAPGLPAMTPAEASIIRDTDHVLGAAEPLVSIIEYGDFQ